MDLDSGPGRATRKGGAQCEGLLEEGWSPRGGGDGTGVALHVSAQGNFSSLWVGRFSWCTRGRGQKGVGQVAE